MRNILSAVIVLLMALTITVEAVKTKDKGKQAKSEGQCAEWKYEKCVPNSGDCGAGIREASCNDQTKKFKCKIPCNWKRNFGADCKYKFARWGDCDSTTGNRTRSGTLKKAMFNLYCQPTITVYKPCNKSPNPTKAGTDKRNKKARKTE